MQSFHDIESLRHIITEVKTYAEFCGLPLTAFSPVTFRGTVKLHGTNGGVRVSNSNVVAQGRNVVLTPEQDNFGFAKFVESRKLDFRMLSAIATKSISDEVTLYGEWCGQGIQKKVAITSLPKMFVVFAIYNHSRDAWVDIHSVKPNELELKTLNDQSIYLITQAQTFEVSVDFAAPIPAAERISQFTLQVEDCCPFAKFLGAEGMGEGIVWISKEPPLINGEPWMAEGQPKRLYFKSKGEKHKKGEPKAHVPVDPEKVKAISDLVDLILPEWRLEQGFDALRTAGIAIAAESTGEYLKWIAKDILKEESDRIAANSFDWKDVQGQVTTRAKKFFFAHLTEAAGLTGASEVVA